MPMRDFSSWGAVPFGFFKIFSERELRQGKMKSMADEKQKNAENIVPAVERILPGGERRQEVEADMLEVRNMLAAQSGSAARQAALAITCNEEA